jgi:hypothetical protein
MRARGKHPNVTAAAAHEPACFLWAAATAD